MKTGFQAVQEAIDRSAERNQGGSGFLPYLNWKDDRKEKGESYQKTLRFLTDEVVPCKIYEYIPCKDGKMRDFIVPSSVGVEGPDYVKESGVRVTQYGNKNNLIEPKARDMTIGLAVLREEVSEMVDGRRVLSYKDKMETVKYEKDGEEVEETRPMFGLIKQSNQNFWGTVAGYWSRYGTIIDRDYQITRNGGGVDTNYTIIPCDPIEGLRDEEEVKAAYDPPTTLEKVIQDLASPERAKKLLLGEGESEGEGKSQANVSTSSGSNPGSQFDDFRQQLIDQS